MPFVSEVSKTISVEKSQQWTGSGGVQNLSYGKAVLKVTTNNNKVNYTVTMTTSVKKLVFNTDKNEEEWVDTGNQPYIALYLSIGNNEIYNSYYAANGKFPTKSGSTASGSIEVGTAENISVVLKISPSVNAVTKPSYWRKSETTLSRTWYSYISGGTLSVEDRFNNTFFITATPGSGTNNPVVQHEVIFGYSSDYDSNMGAFAGLKSLSIIDNSAAERTVYVKSITTPTYGSEVIKTLSKNIRQYVGPSKPGKPVISYSKNRLTIREPWTFTWPAAEAANTSSPVKGYRISVIKITEDNENGEAITGLISRPENNTLIKGSGTNTYIDRESTSCTIIFDPVKLGFKAGDKVKVGLYAYTRYGENNSSSQLFASQASENQVFSETYTVQNAGIMRVKNGDSWREGQVFVKVGGAWKEADTVYTKVGGSWKESQ